MQVRRVEVEDYAPGELEGFEIKILQWGASIAGMSAADILTYKANADNYSRVRYKSKPNKSWAIPFVTGYDYKLHF